MSVPFCTSVALSMRRARGFSRSSGSLFNNRVGRVSRFGRTVLLPPPIVRHLDGNRGGLLRSHALCPTLVVGEHDQQDDRHDDGATLQGRKDHRPNREGGADVREYIGELTSNVECKGPGTAASADT